MIAQLSDQYSSTRHRPQTRVDAGPQTKAHQSARKVRLPLKQLGFECDTALSVATAANLLGARRYDIVFLDLDMPIKTGFDLAAETRRSDGPNRRSRIVSISAADVPDERRGWPFDGHLTKPITMHAIQRALSPSQRSQQLRRNDLEPGRLLEEEKVLVS